MACTLENCVAMSSKDKQTLIHDPQPQSGEIKAHIHKNLFVVL